MHDDSIWLYMLVVFVMIGVFLLLSAGCGGFRPGGVNADPSPTVVVEPSIVAEGDVEQRLETVQETLTDIKNLQQSAQTELVGRMEGVENVVQNVKTEMHDLGANQLNLEKERLDHQFKTQAIIAGLVIGIMLIMIAAPAVGGVLVPVVYITGISLMAAPVVIALILAFLLA